MQFRILTWATAIFLTAGLPFSVLAAEEPPTASETGGVAETAATALPAAEPTPTKMTILQAVEKGKAMLRIELTKRQKAEKKPPTYASKKSPLHVAWAVWDRDTDRITLYGGTKTGTKLKLDDPAAPQIKVTLDAGLGSRYSVPDNRLAVGVLFPILTAVKVKTTTVYQAERVVIAPYNRAFFVPEVLGAGSDYLSFRVKDAFDDLRARGVKSRTFKDRLLVDVVDPYLIKSVVVIEHTGHDSLLNREDPETALGKFFVDLALNQDETFGKAVSAAGARGLAQFIPSTYKLYVKNRTELGLIADFSAGMADHVNALKAEAAYLDESLSQMPEGLRNLYLRDASQAAAFLAAAYNGGSVRVRRAFNHWGELWAESHTKEISKLSARNEALIDQIEAYKKKVKKAATKKEKTKLEDQIWTWRKERKGVLARLDELKTNSLKEETVLYVAKARKVYGMLAVGMYATPNAPSGALPTPIQPVPAVVAAIPAADASSDQLALRPAGGQMYCFAEGCVLAN